MKQLISMTDFVLEQDEKRVGMRDYCNLIVNYANFLKKPLELWMFAPCDENGNVLDEFVHIVEGGFSREYQEAKERCLFEGCVYDDVMQEIRSEKGIVLFHLPKKELFTVEMLVKYNLRLTATEIKQIGV